MKYISNFENLKKSSVLTDYINEFEIIQSISTEIINELYSTLRLLKRLNKKSSIPTTELATMACIRSNKTLEKIYAK